MSVFKSKLMLAVGAFSVDRHIAKQYGNMPSDSSLDEII